MTVTGQWWAAESGKKKERRERDAPAAAVVATYISYAKHVIDTKTN